MAGPTRGAADGDHVPDDDLDAQWAALTARLGELRLPAEEELEPQPEPRPPAAAPAPGPRDYSPAAETEDDDRARDVVDGFVAPDPEPLSRSEPLLVVAWGGVLGGLAVMLLCVLLWRSAPGLVWLVAAGALAVGVGLLLWRMPARRDTDDYDDGAVV
ncbi:hypothetical protein SAMN05216184_101471 [Georgenia satyanarayanai]|uniref:Uncharacterized protein n=1 Tax=Georgenia satyanarayanai TaxID=860221 RepID=A0A2Y8ZXL6_9MICO|nr:hypothetical protein [Georgenia satyanarayanai]PYG02006.1 hypothetical protein A8987_101471 [Georgenia satyanarayanai]SSA36814.1 hypothetical protein SAMN05216184_101471 [Georgenia satyanarayanai]